MLRAAPLESTRFRLRIFRALADSLDAEAIVAQLVDERVDVAILRLSPQATNGLRNIHAYGLHPIHADTLVIHECWLQEFQPRPLKNPPGNIRIAGPADAPAIAELMRAVFSEYPNHYRANPLLDRQGALDGYCEWALDHIEKAGRITWISCVGNRIAAIACSSFDEQSRACQGVLHGVHPEFSGNGYYTDLIRYTQIHFRNLGYRRLSIATQAGNLHVQRVWGRESFSLAEVFETFHVNALLDTQRPDSLQSTLVFSEHSAIEKGDALSQFLKTGGDLLSSSGRKNSTSCSGAIFKMPSAGQACYLHIRPYRCADASGHVVWSATLCDHGGRICGIAQYTSTSAP